MPLVELVVPARVVYVAQHRVVQIPRPSLVVAGREKLDELPPVLFVFRVEKPFSVHIKQINRRLQIVQRRIKVLMAEIVQRKLLRVDLVHGAARVRDRADLVLIGFFMPVQRCGHIELHVDHAQELSVILTGSGERMHKL